MMPAEKGFEGPPKTRMMCARRGKSGLALGSPKGTSAASAPLVNAWAMIRGGSQRAAISETLKIYRVTRRLTRQRQRLHLIICVEALACRSASFGVKRQNMFRCHGGRSA
jgi:hypothetical protein